MIAANRSHPTDDEPADLAVDWTRCRAGGIERGLPSCQSLSLKWRPRFLVVRPDLRSANSCRSISERSGSLLQQDQSSRSPIAPARSSLIAPRPLAAGPPAGCRLLPGLRLLVSRFPAAVSIRTASAGPPDSTRRSQEKLCSRWPRAWSKKI